MRAKSSPFRDLTTSFEEGPGPGWEQVYPRPQLRRELWLSLCGEWSLSVKKGASQTPLGPIRVPFPPESRLSGVRRTLKRGECFVYEKCFTLPPVFAGKRVLLHFEAVDQTARVWVNGAPAGTHTGGYLPFSFDVTPLLLPGENLLRVEAADPLDRDLPYGKQRRRRGGMWYTPVSGIWQSVWLEGVPSSYIRSLRLTPTLESITIETEGGGEEKTVVIRTPDKEICLTYRGDSITVPIPDPILWSPGQPHLYPFTLTAGEDTVASYFALRTVSIQRRKGLPCICLNGQPLFFHALLDQGYFSDGIYLPATPQGYENDVRTALSLGFNTLRKHIKVESALFYYYCDKLGCMVFQDMVNSGPYHYVMDTALPTVFLGLRKGLSHRASRRRRAIFEAQAAQTVRHLYNHPCVLYYTIFNEGWGQYESDRLYRHFRAMDPSRIWDATSGWFAGKESDVRSEHIYFRRVDLPPSPQRPLVLSEFGGYSCKLPDHAFNLDKTYGYKKFDRLDRFTQALEGLYRQEILPAISRGLCAAVLTQLSDVEDETNGLLTFDRRVVKGDAKALSALAEELQEAFRQRFGGTEEDRSSPL